MSRNNWSCFYILLECNLLLGRVEKNSKKGVVPYASFHSFSSSAPTWHHTIWLFYSPWLAQHMAITHGCATCSSRRSAGSCVLCRNYQAHFRGYWDTGCAARVGFSSSEHYWRPLGLNYDHWCFCVTPMSCTYFVNNLFCVSLPFVVSVCLIVVPIRIKKRGWRIG